MHLTVPALHVPAPRRSLRAPVTLLLLTAVYAAALAVALTAPREHALAGCMVLAGLTARWAAHRHRAVAATMAGTVTAATAAVDSVLPEPGAPAVRAVPVGRAA